MERLLCTGKGKDDDVVAVLGLREEEGKSQAGVRRTAPADAGSSTRSCGLEVWVSRWDRRPKVSAQVCRYRSLRTCLAVRRTGRDEIWEGKLSPSDGLILAVATGRRRLSGVALSPRSWNALQYDMPSVVRPGVLSFLPRYFLSS